MRKAVKLSECFNAAVFGKKNDLPDRGGRFSALARNTEFFFEIVINICDRFYGFNILQITSPIQLL